MKKNYSQEQWKVRFHLDTPVYKRIGASDHQFEDGQYYSLRSLGLILGMTPVGIRQRCIVDEWPTLPVWTETKRIRRPQFIDGGFLKSIQQTVRGGDV